MEKRLLFGAFLLLIFEVLWLAADMDLIFISGISKVPESASRELIGVVEERHYSLKRRFQNSIVWEDTGKNEPLYLFDSVLTLDRSSAILKLHGNTQLKLSENTLVFLEPSSKSDVDQLKIRFSRGDVRSRNPDRDVAIQTTTWTVEINKGSEVNLRAKDSEQLEVEVLQGNVKLQGEAKTTQKEFKTGDVIRMQNDHVEHQRLTDEIKWRTPIENLPLLRKYSHHFPVDVFLQWEGSARELSWENPEGKTQNISLAPDQLTYTLPLEKGLHHFRLRSDTGTTPILPVEVWQAPVIHTFWPLPRDRYTSGQSVMFSWSPMDDIQQFKLVFREPGQTKHNYEKSVQQKNVVHENIQLVGNFEWGVEGSDSLGFTIPSFYYTPVYFLVDPLAPPVLKAPEIRQPAQEKKSSWLWLRELFISTAFAERTREPTPLSADYQAVFHWEPVKTATGYYIEIDDDADFKSPLAMEKTKTPEFIWSKFKLGKYYWRVAAEGNKGQMGLFSPVTPVDLSDPKVFDRRPQPPPTPKPKIAVKPKEEVDLNGVEDEKPKPIYRLTPSQRKMEEQEELERVRFIHGHFRYTPTGEMSYLQADNFKSEFRGFYLLGASTQLEIPWNEVEDLRFHFSYRQAAFRATPGSDFPFQEKLSRTKITASAMYGQTSQIHYGAKISTVQTMKRLSFEQLEFENKLAYGPMISLPMAARPYLSQFDFWVMLGPQLWLLGLETNFGYEIKMGEQMTLEYGASFEGQFLKTPDQREIAITPKIFLGVGW